MSQTSSPTLQDYAWLALRVGSAGFLGLAHGLPKLLGFAQKADVFPDPLHVGSALSLSLATASELGGALLVLLGLFTRPAAASIVFTLLVAGFVTHGGDPWSKKELALLYVVTFLPLAIAGPGGFSLDALRARRRTASSPASAAQPSAAHLPSV
jgi:putative oxidoreductase